VLCFISILQYILQLSSSVYQFKVNFTVLIKFPVISSDNRGSESREMNSYPCFILRNRVRNGAGTDHFLEEIVLKLDESLWCNLDNLKVFSEGT